MVFAYIDPGAGSMLIQALLAGLLAVPFFLRGHIGQIARRFRRSSAQEQPSTDDQK